MNVRVNNECIYVSYPSILIEESSYLICDKDVLASESISVSVSNYSLIVKSDSNLV